MHWIARHILKELAFSDGRRYSELKPDQVEGNLFQYHSRDLEKQGLITRDRGLCALTPKGSQYVADLNTIRPSNYKRSPRPVVMIAARNDQHEYLLFRWKRHPYRGQVSLPFGRQFAGESGVEAALQQLLNKAGYQADLAPLGSLALITPGDHLLIQVYVASNLIKAHEPDGITGEAFWGDPRSNTQELLPGIDRVIDWIENNERRQLAEIIVDASQA